MDGRRAKAGLLFHMKYSGKLKKVISSKLRPEIMKLPGERKPETLQNIAVGKDFFLTRFPKHRKEKQK